MKGAHEKRVHNRNSENLQYCDSIGEENLSILLLAQISANEFVSSGNGIENS
jgi:hypothetical protein